jgi:hypothetical protein
MKGNISLAPYSWEQITNGEKLPKKISSIRNDLETGGKLKFNFVIEQIANASKAINIKTNNKFVILGSIGMYATINELRENDTRLKLLEQRISGGKNDYDIGVHPDKLQSIMSDFGWSKDTKKLQRGRVGDGSQMIDIMGRGELPHFPWRQTEVAGRKILVQAPEEMIFEKMTAFINPGASHNGESRIREVKWGIDIKLLKTYLMMKNSWSEANVEKHLTERWGEYVEDTRYQGVAELSERVAKGESVGEVVADALKKRLGKEQIVDVRQELLGIFGQGSETNIQALLSSSNDVKFSVNLRCLVDLQAGAKLSYEQATQKATEEYTKLLVDLQKN